MLSVFAISAQGLVGFSPRSVTRSSLSTLSASASVDAKLYADAQRTAILAASVDDAIVEKVNSLHGSLVDALAEVDAAKASIAELEAESVAAAAKSRLLAEQRDGFEEKFMWRDAQASSLAAEAATAKKNEIALGERLSSAEGALVLKQSVLKETEAALAAARADHAEAATALAELKEVLGEAEREIMWKDAQYSTLSGEKTTAETQLATTSAALAALRDATTALEKKLAIAIADAAASEAAIGADLRAPPAEQIRGAFSVLRSAIPSQAKITAAETRAVVAAKRAVIAEKAAAVPPAITSAAAATTAAAASTTASWKSGVKAWVASMGPTEAEKMAAAEAAAKKKFLASMEAPSFGPSPPSATAVFIGRVREVTASVKAVVAAATASAVDKAAAVPPAVAAATSAAYVSTVSTAFDTAAAVKAWAEPTAAEVAAAAAKKEAAAMEAAKKKFLASIETPSFGPSPPSAAELAIAVCQTQLAPITAACRAQLKTMRLKVASAVAACKAFAAAWSPKEAGEVMTVCMAGVYLWAVDGAKGVGGLATKAATGVRTFAAKRLEAMQPTAADDAAAAKKKWLADLEARSFGPKAVSSAKEIEVSADLAGVITKLFSSPIERDYAGEVKVVAQPAFGI